MSACCHMERGRSRPLARRISGAAGSIMPGLLLGLLPKCPLCLAAWLTVATGIGVSAAAAEWVRGAVVILWVAGAAAAAGQIIRRRSGRRPAFTPVGEWRKAA